MDSEYVRIFKKNALDDVRQALKLFIQGSISDAIAAELECIAMNKKFDALKQEFAAFALVKEKVALKI